MTDREELIALRRMAALQDRQNAENKRSQAADEKSYGVGEGSVLENIGAGMHRGFQGMGQLVGLSSGEDVREHDKYREMAAGDSWTNKGLQLAGEIAPQMALGGPTAALGKAALGKAALSNPGAGATLSRAVAAWAAKSPRLATGAKSALMGAGSGAATATDNPDVISGKVNQAGFGTILGGLTPSVGRALKKAGGGVADFVKPSRVGNRLAVRALTDDGATAASVAADNMRAQARALALPGQGTRDFTTGMVANQETKALQSVVEASAGAKAKPIADKLTSINAAQADALRKLSPVGEEAWLDNSIEKVYTAARKDPSLPGGNLGQGGRLVKQAFAEMEDLSSGEVKNAIRSISKRWNQYEATAIKNNDWSHIYDFRKEVLGDTVASLKGAGKPNAAKNLNRLLESNLRPILDETLHAVSKGATRSLIGPTGKVAPLLVSKGQLGNVEGVLNKLDSAPLDAAGESIVNSPAVIRSMDKLAKGGTALQDDIYGTPLLSSDQAGIVGKLQAQAAALRQGKAAGRGVSGATARRTSEVPGLFERGTVSGKTVVGPMTVATVAAIVAHPAIGVLLAGAGMGRLRSASGAAKRLTEILADPDEALKLLDKLSKTGDLEKIPQLKEALVSAARPLVGITAEGLLEEEDAKK